MKGVTYLCVSVCLFYMLITAITYFFLVLHPLVWGVRRALNTAVLRDGRGGGVQSSQPKCDSVIVLPSRSLRGPPVGKKNGHFCLSGCCQTFLLSMSAVPFVLKEGTHYPWISLSTLPSASCSCFPVLVEVDDQETFHFYQGIASVQKFPLYAAAWCHRAAKPFPRAS